MFSELISDSEDEQAEEAKTNKGAEASSGSDAGIVQWDPTDQNAYMLCREGKVMAEKLDKALPDAVLAFIGGVWYEVPHVTASEVFGRKKGRKADKPKEKKNKMPKPELEETDKVGSCKRTKKGAKAKASADKPDAQPSPSIADIRRKFKLPIQDEGPNGEKLSIQGQLQRNHLILQLICRDLSLFPHQRQGL